MGEKWTKEKWNSEIIQPINELINDPDPGCPELDPLDEASPRTIWTKEAQQQGRKASIKIVQDKLKEICDENEFGEIPDKWKQSIIDELKEAIEEGWCNCCEETVIDFPIFFVPGIILLPSLWTGWDIWLGAGFDLVPTPYPIGKDINSVGDAHKSIARENGNTHWDYLTFPDALESFEGLVQPTGGVLGVRTGRLRQDTFVPTNIGSTAYSVDDVIFLPGEGHGYYQIYCKEDDPVEDWPSPLG